jgi:hypothetical protein
MAWLARGWVVGVIVLVVGCGPDTAGEGESAADESSSAAGSSEESSTGVQDGPECLDVDASLSLQLDISAGAGSGSCMASEVSGTHLRVTCDGGSEGPYDIVVNAQVAPAITIALEVGAMVEVESIQVYTHGEPSELLDSVIVREAVTHELVLAAIESNEVGWTSELAPLQLDPVVDACAAVVDESNCQETQRRFWEASVAGESALVGDGARTVVGAYVVHVQRAVDGALIDCVDIESDVYEALIVRGS